MKKIVLSIFAVVICTSILFAAVPKPDDLKLTSVVPKVFAPQESLTTANRVKFTYAYNGTGEITVRIYDVTGAMVRRNIDRESDTVMCWDGTDKDGGVVKAGIYIYQIEVGKNIINGTVIVAK